MIDILKPEFKLLFTILFATYVYSSNKLGIYAQIYKPIMMKYMLAIAYNTIYCYSCFEIQVNNLLKFINPYIKAVKKFFIMSNKNSSMVQTFSAYILVGKDSF